jgi:hypothetical protein
MLASVDLDLQLERRLRGRLGREAEDQVHRVPRLLAVALAEPGKRVADGVHRRADRLCLRLHQVDVFRVPQRLLEQELVDGRAAAERDLSGKRGRVEQVAERTADD